MGRYESCIKHLGMLAYHGKLSFFIGTGFSYLYLKDIQLGVVYLWNSVRKIILIGIQYLKPDI